MIVPRDTSASKVYNAESTKAVSEAEDTSETPGGVNIPLLREIPGDPTSIQDTENARQMLKASGAKFFQSAKLSAKESLVDVLRLGGGALLLAAAIPTFLVGGAMALTRGIVELAKGKPVEGENYGKELMKFAVSSATTGVGLMLVSAVDMAMSTVRRISQATCNVKGKQINDTESDQPKKVQEPLNYARLLAVKTMGGALTALNQKIASIATPGIKNQIASNRWITNITNIINLEPNKNQKTWLKEKLSDDIAKHILHVLKVEKPPDDELAQAAHKRFFRSA